MVEDVQYLFFIEHIRCGDHPAQHIPCDALAMYTDQVVGNFGVAHEIGFQGIGPAI